MPRDISTATALVTVIEEAVEQFSAEQDVRVETDNFNVGVHTERPDDWNDLDEPREVTNINIGYTIPHE